jgi:iron(III) transport system ATP-binding protein
MLELIGLSALGSRMPHELSGGQQQRVALARALAPQPEILLLDEPFSNLDAALRAQVRGEVRDILRESGTTCVFVTHDQEEALSFADTVAVMLDGRVAQMADPPTLYQKPISREIAAFVGEANFLAGVAEGETVKTVLGRVKLDEPCVGKVDALIRPEAIRITEHIDSNIAARVLWREYYGHDQRVGLALDDGTIVIARAGAWQAIREGIRVGVWVAPPVRVFSAE